MIESRSESPSVLVLGGGPAGGFAALELARRRCHVELLEGQPAVAWKIGETLPPEARIHLQRLNYLDQVHRQQHLPCYGVVSVWGDSVATEKDFISNPYGHGWQLDRVQFESELLKAVVAAGGKVHLGIGDPIIKRVSAGWQVESTSRSWRGDWLLDCTGRHGALVRQEGGVYEQLDDMVSVFAIARTLQQSDHDSRTYVEALPHGWCYSALMPNRTRIVAMQMDRDFLPASSATIDWLWDQLSNGWAIRQLLEFYHYEFCGLPRILPAHSGRFQRCAGSNWLAVGDAAMTFDPLSGQGTAKALESAYCAVRCVLNGDDYQAACDQLWRAFLDERRSFYWAESRWPDHPFWSRRHTAVERTELRS